MWKYTGAKSINLYVICTERDHSENKMMFHALTVALVLGCIWFYVYFPLETKVSESSKFTPTLDIK